MIRRCPTTADLINSGRFSVLITILSLVCFWKTSHAQVPCAEGIQQFTWYQDDWVSGKRSGLVRVPVATEDSIDMFVKVSTPSQGSFTAFGVETPYVDGHRTWNFGTGSDLGVIFDPQSDQGYSPVTIEVRFSHPVSCLSFEISDIDVSGSRIDSIVVFGNDTDLLPSLSPVASRTTVRTHHNTAGAIGYPSGPSRSGSALQSEDAGTVSVDFGSDIVESLTITYLEASGTPDPGGRGIGVLGNLVFDKVKLEPLTILNYTIEKTDDCEPVLRLETNFEYGLDEYIVEYSYDGLNYSEAYRFSAVNSYTDLNSYEEVIPRKLNGENYFRLAKKTMAGRTEALEMIKISGTDCYNLTSVNIYPNPSYRDFFYVEIEASRAQETDMAIFDQSGRQMLRTRYELKKGPNWLKISSKAFSPGVYHVRFAAGDEIVSRKISII